VYDPWADSNEVKDEFGFDLTDLTKKPTKNYHAVILTVAHKEFLNEELRSHLVEGGILYDVKGILDTNSIDARM
jgi:UDP-N-acetyl-D-galactosamine dehydrogenase